MRKDIHPENYRLVAFKDMSNDDVFLTKSTAEAKETIEVDGVEYPLVKLEISRTSHPYYTGKTKLVDTAGRIDKFKNKYKKFKKEDTKEAEQVVLFNEIYGRSRCFSGAFFIFGIQSQAMNYILSDGNHREDLFPFTFTRPVSEIRVGILTISEKWEKWLNAPMSHQTEEYLSKKYPLTATAENTVINGSYLPNTSLVEAIKTLRLGEALIGEEGYIAYVTENLETGFEESAYTAIPFDEEVLTIKNTWDIFSNNAAALQADFDLITKGRKSQPIPDTNQVKNPDNIFIEEGATVEFCILNASTGPIYIGKNALMMEGCMVRGGLALCENAILKMGAKIYGAVTAGPGCKLGGEVNNAVLFANSNKGHDGFLGNSVLGEWCNIGADTNTSNLKNNYAEVRLWNYKTEGFTKTGLQFCGLMMGDHSKCGINVMFNTGTVVGVSANIFGSGFPRNFIPSFSWGGATGTYTTFRTNKAFEVADAMMKRRNMEFNDTEAQILEYVFEFTQKWRNF